MKGHRTESAAANSTLPGEPSPAPRVEEVLGESAELFQQLMHNIREVFWVRHPARSRIIYVSPAYEEIWGRTCESLYAAPRDWLAAVHPEDQPRVSRAALQMSVSGEYHEEYRIIRPDGTTRRIQDRAFPVRDESGRLCRIVGIAEDVTERKQAETQLATLAHAVESTSELVCITDLRDRFIFANRAFLEAYGYTEAEILGKTPDILFSPKNSPSLMAEILEQTRLGGWRGEVLDRRKDGTEFPIFLSTSRVKDPTGRVIGLMGVAQDITDRKELEREVLESSANERRRIGHDLHDSLGQYLTGIAFRAKALEQELAAAGSPHAREANEVAAFIGKAISQTRSLARGLDPIEVEASGLIAPALQNLALATEELFKVTCRFHCPDSALRVGSPIGVALYRIAQEAIHNAVTHGDAHRIQIELKLGADHLWLRIQDDGIGFQVTKQRRTGMGLRLMNYRASSVGATLRIHSRPRHGTEVQCLVPRALVRPRRRK